MRGDDDASGGKADYETAEDREQDVGGEGAAAEMEDDVRSGCEDQRSGSDAAEAGIDEGVIFDVLGSGVEDRDTDEEAGPDHGAGDAEYVGGGAERVADEDGDEWAEAAHDEHPRGESDDDEEQSGVMEDEAGALFHVFEDAGEARFFCDDWGALAFDGSAYSVPFGDDQREGGDEGGGGEKADGVGDVADLFAEMRDDEGGGGAADDAHDEHDLLDERVGGAQTVERNGAADGYPLRRAEEARNDADGGEDGIEAVDVVDEDQHQDQAGTDKVAGDKGSLDGPAVDENAAENAKDSDGEEVGDLDSSDLLGCGVQLEGHDRDHGEQGKEVAEDGDDLGVPEAAHGGDTKDRAHGERGRWELIDYGVFGRHASPKLLLTGCSGAAPCGGSSSQPKEGSLTILETSVWIDLLYGRLTAQTEWIGRNISNIALTDLILTEILQGIRQDALYIVTRKHLLELHTFDTYGTDLAVASAQNYRALRKKGMKIRSTIDCLTATFCILQGHSLLHNDGDFHPFEKHLGLKVIHV